MNYFISGGCKNGKSFFAQRTAKDMSVSAGVPLYYVATMLPADDEDRARIRRHLKEREGWGFETIEQATDILTCLEPVKYATPDPSASPDLSPNPNPDGSVNPSASLSPNPGNGGRVDLRGVFLLDSVTALLSNEMFPRDGTVDMDAADRVAKELARFALRTGNTVFVSDYIYSDAMLYDELTLTYRRGLAHIDRTLAACCQRVAEVSFSNITFFK